MFAGFSLCTACGQLSVGENILRRDQLVETEKREDESEMSETTRSRRNRLKWRVYEAKEDDKIIKD